jgi:hypothetical protein
MIDHDSFAGDDAIIDPINQTPPRYVRLNSCILNREIEDCEGLAQYRRTWNIDDIGAV